MSNQKQRYILIIDYNLTRYDDVKAMTVYAQRRYQLKTILIRPNPTIHDFKIADQVIDLDPRSDSFIQDAKVQLYPYVNNIIAGLTFSDNAVYSGAKLLEELELEVDSATMAEAAFSKISYRKMEHKYKKLFNPQHLFVPNFKIIYTMDDLVKFANKNPQGFVLKPSCEGNNRGVLLFKSGDKLEKATETIRAFVSTGVICEELITFEDEYSFDGLAHLSFLTKKLSSKGMYPVEYGQVITPNVNGLSAELVSRAGTIANLLVGQRLGPFHNEIKVSNLDGKAAVIEPNRRPAGMRIWSIAEKVFHVNFYHLWIDRLVSKNLPPSLQQPRGTAAIRMLGCPYDGILNLGKHFQNNSELLFKQTLELLSKTTGKKHNLNWFDFKMNKLDGDYVLNTPRDNSDFLAQVCLYTGDNSIDLIPILDELNDCWLSIIKHNISGTCGEVA